MYPNFTVALFTITRIWKESTCPLTDEWIKKIWYIHTMNITQLQKNYALESVLMRQMNLEPITQSKVRQKEKNKDCISTHLWNLETYLQGNNRDADIENRFVDTEEEAEGGRNLESSTETYTLPYGKQIANEKVL